MRVRMRIPHEEEQVVRIHEDEEEALSSSSRSSNILKLYHIEAGGTLPLEFLIGSVCSQNYFENSHRKQPQASGIK